MPYTTAVSTGSILYRCVEHIRFMLNEPETDATFSDTYLLNMVVVPAMKTVMSRFNLNRDNPIRLRFSFSLEAGTEYYRLPPNMQEVYRVSKLADNKLASNDFIPREEESFWGPGWILEGNTLAFRPVPLGSDSDWVIWYVPSADFKPHYGTGLQSLTDDPNVITLSNSPTFGELDRRSNAYAGAILRLLPTSSTGVQQEHIVEESYLDGSSWKARLRLTPDPSVAGQSSLLYEVLPPLTGMLWKSAADLACIELGVSRDLTEKQMRQLYMNWERSMKTSFDDLVAMQTRLGKFFRNATPDNRDRTLGGLGDVLM